MKLPDFIGRTAIIGKIVSTKIPAIKAGRFPDPLERRFLFTGPPGVAKTELARCLAAQAAGHPLNIDFRMGTQISVEVVRDWLRNSCYRPMMGDLLVHIADEIDSVPPAALTEVRQYLDALPLWVVFFGTTNKTVKQLPETLQSRFIFYPFQPEQTSVILAELKRRYPEVPEAILTQIATNCAGNVRAAFTDASSALDAIRFQQLAA